MREEYVKYDYTKDLYQKLAGMEVHPKETFDENFRLATRSKKIFNIAFSAIKDHNAMKGLNLDLISVRQARVMNEVLGSLYLLDLLVHDSGFAYILLKMVWVGESREPIICFQPRINHLIYSDDDYQFDFDFKKPFPSRPSSTKTKKLAEFALDHFNSSVGQWYNFKLENKKDVKITLGKWGSRTYPKGAAGYTKFNVFLFDLKKLVKLVKKKDKHSPKNLMVVTKRWQQTLDDDKARSFLCNLVRPRDYPVTESKLGHVVTHVSLLEVDLESPKVVTMVWFAVECELFKRNRELEVVRVVHGEKTICAGRVFYLTVEALDQGVLKKFDTSVWVLGDYWCIAAPFEETTPPFESLDSSTAGPSHQCYTKTL